MESPQDQKPYQEGTSHEYYNTRSPEKASSSETFFTKRKKFCKQNIRSKSGKRKKVVQTIRRDAAVQAGYTRSFSGMVYAAKRMGLGTPNGEKKPPRTNQSRYPEMSYSGEKVQIDVKEVPYDTVKSDIWGLLPNGIIVVKNVIQI